LREIALAQALGTSRGTIREAIRHLLQEGLAEHELHRGAYVPTLSLVDRLDVYVAREVIEVSAAARLVESGDDVDLGPLEKAIEELRAAAIGQSRPTEEVIAADIRFHQELVGTVGSPRLNRAYETLAAEARILLRSHPEYPWQTYVSDHQTLLDAFRRRDPEAPDLVSKHLRLSVDLIRSEIASSEPDWNGRESAGNR
jgi:DNA-binding GntR family transcriptional regulator